MRYIASLSDGEMALFAAVNALSKVMIARGMTTADEIAGKISDQVEEFHVAGRPEAAHILDQLVLSFLRSQQRHMDILRHAPPQGQAE